MDIEAFPFPAVLDNTMREDWLRCPHYFFRRHIQGLRATQLIDGTETLPVSIHLHFGGCLARGLEVTRRAWVSDGLGEEQSLKAGAEALLIAWGAADMPAPTTRNEEAKSLDNCLLAHDAYFREWPLDDPMQQLGVAEGEPLVEFCGAIPIPGCFHPVSGDPLLYAGRFDGILNRGALWGLDDKTTGSSVASPGWRSQWKLNGQFTGYTWIAQEWGYSLAGFLIHGIQILKTDIRFAEVIAPRPRWMVETWLKQLQRDVRAMADSYSILRMQAEDEERANAHAFTQALGHACVHFNAPCSYLEDLCGQPNPDDWLDKFTVERWNPLRRAVDE
jgi:hypothetical protein